MALCYWCGVDVADGDGAREHIIPRTLLQDVSGDTSEFIIPAENSHEKCNHDLAHKYEHDFCQIIFHYSYDDPKARKHCESKIRNLERRMVYASHQFKKMRKRENCTEIELSAVDKRAFEECIKKIIKGLFFKKIGRYLDLDNEYSFGIVWGTLNREYDNDALEQAKKFSELLGDEAFRGNNVFKFRFKQIVDGQSFLWELVFYDRFPAYAVLFYKDEKKLL